ncbi:hypothetical protein C2E23DRAFT_614896 [Lenzites betulinus]|nr:hypothetical protein C2E23DRAFT_614896 [Lenzites betulinus]
MPSSGARRPDAPFRPLPPRRPWRRPRRDQSSSHSAQFPQGPAHSRPVLSRRARARRTAQGPRAVRSRRTSFEARGEASRAGPAARYCPVDPPSPCCRTHRHSAGHAMLQLRTAEDTVLPSETAAEVCGVSRRDSSAQAPVRRNDADPIPRASRLRASVPDMEPDTERLTRPRSCPFREPTPCSSSSELPLCRPVRVFLLMLTPRTPSPHQQNQRVWLSRESDSSCRLLWP